MDKKQAKKKSKHSYLIIITILTYPCTYLLYNINQTNVDCYFFGSLTSFSVFFVLFCFVNCNGVTRQDQSEEM